MHPHPQPSGAAFDVVLLLHVGCVVAGIATTATAAGTAARVRRLAGSGTPLPEALRRYFRPGVNWAGRTVWGIPVFGFALVAMSQGAYAVTDAWVLIGLVLFVALALVAEGVLWPAERQVQLALAAGRDAHGSDGASDPVAAATTMVRSASFILALLAAGTVVMIAQP